jgi:hypothetical protein
MYRPDLPGSDRMTGECAVRMRGRILACDVEHNSAERGNVYQVPKLERFGSFRELTLVRAPKTGKTVIGDDSIPGIGLDCNPNVPPSDPRGCLRS